VCSKILATIQESNAKEVVRRVHSCRNENGKRIHRSVSIVTSNVSHVDIVPLMLATVITSGLVFQKILSKFPFGSNVQEWMTSKMRD
jgi:hypothetical protein